MVKLKDAKVDSMERVRIVGWTVTSSQRKRDGAGSKWLDKICMNCESAS